MPHFLLLKKTWILGVLTLLVLFGGLWYAFFWRNAPVSPSTSSVALAAELTWKKVSVDEPAYLGQTAAWFTNFATEPDAVEHLSTSSALRGDEYIARKDFATLDAMQAGLDAFRKHYEDATLAAGYVWHEIVEGVEIQGIQADGPLGGTDGRIKVESGALQAVLWSHQLISGFDADESDEPLSLTCPCGIEFRTFISAPTPLLSVLPSRFGVR